MGVYASWLVDAARMATAGTGKQVIVSPGWQTRGQGPLRVIEIVVGHHTATPESAPGDYPSLNVVQNGRAGLIGLLSQLGLGRSGNVYVIGAGLAYHAGASAYAGYVDLNDESIGIEAEDSGDGTWTPDQLFMYPRLIGACLHYIRRGVDRYASHRTVAVPAGRKNDPAGITDDWMRQRAAQFQQGKQDDMALKDDIDGQALMWRIEALINGRDTVKGGPTAGEVVEPVRLLNQLKAQLGGLSDDEANLLAAIRAAAAGDAEAIAAHLAPLLSGLALGRVPDDQFDELVRAVNDENDRREAARANTPVPPA